MNYENEPTGFNAIGGFHWLRIGRDVICAPGNSGCSSAKFLKAKPSEFHDETLIAATNTINSILEGTSKNEPDRSLAFLTTNMGVLLAWVEHKSAGETEVTSQNSNEVVATALNLEMPEETTEAQSG